MVTLTIRLPDDKHERINALARRRGTTVSRLIDEMATVMLAQSDAEARFLLRTERGQAQPELGRQLLREARGS